MQSLLLFVPVLLFSVIAHEYAHGYAALKQGDNTALAAGRLTWNPIKHIDLWMTILLPAILWYSSHGTVVLGGAKPVPVDPRNYRNYRRGDIIVSLAGVVTNLLIALACTAVIALLGVVGRADAVQPTAGILQAMMVIGVQLNMLLLAFNLLPIPPLDGSQVLKHFLPVSWALHYQRVGMLGIGILVVLLYVAPQLLNYWLLPANVISRELLSLVRPTVLPSATRWLQ
ncbi:MAG TPA: site-2 protease family protein [Gemmatimonadaceae bacterium]|nr:site-2 protease family protein [Gemmatimonadaceae bacterium]